MKKQSQQEIEKIREKLFSMQDKKYRDFQAKLIPTVAADSVIGVRTPALRTYAKELLKEFPDDNPSYIRLNVEVTNFLPGTAAAEAQAICRSKMCRFCHINAKRKNALSVKSKGMTISEFKTKSPLDVLIQYAQDTNKVVDDEMKSLFAEAERQVIENKGNN